MVVEPTIEDRVKRMEEFLGFHNGDDLPETSKALAYGAVHGTVDLMQELSEIKFQLNDEIGKIKHKLNEILEVINNGNKK